MNAREQSLASRLRRAGVLDPSTAVEHVENLQRSFGLDPEESERLASYMADPDAGLASAVRLAEAAASAGALDDVAAVVADEESATTLAIVLGASLGLGDFLARHPRQVRVLTDLERPAVVASGARNALLSAVGADPASSIPVAGLPRDEAIGAMRVAYRRLLLRVAAVDLASSDPRALLPEVVSALADLAGAALDAGLAIARAQDPHHEWARLAIIGMGKCGGRELNYVSDVDVVYAHAVSEGAEPEKALKVAMRLASGAARACDEPHVEPALWQVDANLRPEGKDGALVRTVASHRAYYERWAETWEFQALLKARPIAGDVDLGQEYVDAVGPMVWQAVERTGFIEDTQAMRRRVEAHLSNELASRHIKLGPGGLRDVEFTVQMLQMVHGRHDDSLRSRTTLEALAALSAGGYISRSDAADMDAAYRFMRVLEHRVQLRRLQRTHLLPVNEDDQRWLARSAGYATRQRLYEAWHDARRTVRARHLDMFYRPILPVVASMTAEEAKLSDAGAKARLAAVGFRDPVAALRHISALTDGVSRRAAIQRQLMPAMIGWFARGSDPDAGLLAFRQLSDQLGSVEWYLRLLRDSRSAAKRLARLLSTSQYVAKALLASAEAVTWLDNDADLTPRTHERLMREADAILRRSDNPEQAMQAVRGLRRRELARIAASDVLAIVNSVEAGEAITDLADVAIASALRIASHEVARDAGLEELPLEMAVIAMGRYGGREMGYASDADVQFVYRPTGDDAATHAKSVASRVRSLLRSVSSQPPLEIDADLRPEGKNGPLARTLDSTRDYYRTWADPWEAQALLRARPCAGSEAVGAEFDAIADELRYPDELKPEALAQMRRLKARMESERLPRGVQPARHLKLGPGGLSDVEWTVQLMQMEHGARVPDLRTTETLPALAAAEDAGLIDAADATSLRTAWMLATDLRGANALRGRSRDHDVLPVDVNELRILAGIVGLDVTGAELDDLHMRVGRRARAVASRLFFGWTEDD